MPSVLNPQNAFDDVRQRRMSSLCPRSRNIRIAIGLVIFLLPFALLVLKLHKEGHALDQPIHDADGHLPIRLVVIGIFAVLVTKRCIDWMRGRRR